MHGCTASTRPRPSTILKFPRTGTSSGSFTRQKLCKFLPQLAPVLEVKEDLSTLCNLRLILHFRPTTVHRCTNLKAVPLLIGSTANQKCSAWPGDILLLGDQDCNPSVKAISGNCTRMRLPTKWSCQVDPHAPLQYYPRPQMTRGNNTWVNLNGVWQWEPAPYAPQLSCNTHAKPCMHQNSVMLSFVHVWSGRAAQEAMVRCDSAPLLIWRVLYNPTMKGSC